MPRDAPESTSGVHQAAAVVVQEGLEGVGPGGVLKGVAKIAVVTDGLDVDGVVPALRIHPRSPSSTQDVGMVGEVTVAIQVDTKPVVTLLCITLQDVEVLEAEMSLVPEVAAEDLHRCPTVCVVVTDVVDADEHLWLDKVQRYLHPGSVVGDTLEAVVGLAWLPVQQNLAVDVCDLRSSRCRAVPPLWSRPVLGPCRDVFPGTTAPTTHSAGIVF
jgi:hypothetical protein